MVTMQTESPEIIEVERKAVFPVAGFLLGMLAGAAVGGVVALLLAPKSGKETRELLMGKVSQTQQMIQDQVSTVKDRASKVRDALRSSSTSTPTTE